ncbi:hypothetical protein GYMLUDRAFT_45415 [Collybiopsis luxurians FD-317 M1]|uniref:Uncharacterized protein n=1 Tax=Collybiopsis luxurians FD-317 M1 TaxID=944289 RepID=A0A0D0CRH0_9AGAR|nr:hypothetical protein GYMLUDRAFT_45415 [Collybiopsis luxurians FD-317 M1]
MATIYVDISAILREVRLLITEIKNERTAEKERTKAAQLLVYRAFSLHPALDYMRPPTGVLADVDWYTELRSTFTSGIFRKLGQNEHFKRMALLGDIGTRARIMVLLLWIIGHRLSEDSLAKLLSTSFGDAIKRSGTTDLETELSQLDSVNKVLVSLRKMIKTKLPLPADRNPFLGRDYNVGDEDKPLPHSSLWGYELPEEQRYEYDVRRNPVLLLRPLYGKVIIPQTKLTMLVIQWAACNFGLGKKVYSASDIDSEAFWNADPPPPSDREDCADLHDDDNDDDYILSDWTSDSSSQNESAFEPHIGVAPHPYERVWADEPTEDFVHSRFCSVYKMHDWAHRSLVRILLFNAFSASPKLRFPPQTISTAVRIADYLPRLLPIELWGYMERFIIACSFLVWQETQTEQDWSPDFSALSQDERGMLIIFVDALKWYEARHSRDLSLHPVIPDIHECLMRPTRRCQGCLDIISLPLLASQDPYGTLNDLPEPDASTCVCGECALICSQLPPNLQSFRHQYFSLISSRPKNCNALVRAWEPVILAAEEWIDGLLSRVECQFTLFPWTEKLDRRIGPAVLELANALDVLVGSELSDEQLLRLIVMLSLIEDYSLALPRSPGPFGLGYLLSMPWAADREDHRPSRDDDDDSEADNGSDQVLFLKGGWMYDTVGLEGVSVVHQREGCSFVRHTFTMASISPVCMPNFRADVLSLFPSLHSSTTTIDPTPSPSPSGLQEEELTKEDMALTFVLSNFQNDVFPLLSVLSARSETGFSAPRGALAALVRVEYLGRTVETFWRPDVKQGSPCEHKELWGRSTRCSFTADELYRRVRPPNPYIDLVPPTGAGDDGESISASAAAGMKELEFGASHDAAAFRRQKALREMMDEHARRLASLTKIGAPLERTRVCMVRCGAKDGPVDAAVVLAASVKKKVYVLNYKECWDCAFARMVEQGRSVGVAVGTKHITFCEECQPS